MGRRIPGERAAKKDELIAIAVLIEAHREEFDSTISTNIQRREWLEKKAANEARKR